MIIRKPYAFLIKYFKVIHIIMFVVFGYFIFAIKDIKDYFTNAVLSNNMSKIASNNTYFSFLYVLFAILLSVNTNEVESENLTVHVAPSMFDEDGQPNKISCQTPDLGSYLPTGTLYVVPSSGSV